SRRPLSSPLFPYTTLFRSIPQTPVWEMRILQSCFAMATVPAVLLLTPPLVGNCANESLVQGVTVHLAERAATLKTLTTLPYVERSEEHTSELQSRSDLVCR